MARVSDSDALRDASLARVAVLGEQTRRRLYALVRAARRPVSRDEAAASIGISRKLAAFHLDKLVRAGPLRARYDARREAPGSDAPKTYEPSDAYISISIPARCYDVLADVLIDAVRAGSSGEDALEAAMRIARLRGAEYGASQRERLRPGRLGAERALEILDERGYEPQRESPTELRLRNCPFYPFSARAPGVVCAISQAWLNGLLEGLDITTVEMVPDPDPSYCCVMFAGTRR